MSDLCTKMAAQHLTADEVIHFIINIPVMGLKAMKKTHLERRGMPSLTQLMTVTLQKKV